MKIDIKKNQKRRAMTTENVRRVKLAGHEAEQEFADLIGGQKYPGSRKKDVVDAQGNTHSIKNGERINGKFFYMPKADLKIALGFMALHFLFLA